MAENTTSPWALPYPSAVGKVNLGATDINELATKLNTIFNEKFLVVKTSATEITAAAGELVEMTAAGTVNLPKAAASNTTVGVWAQKGEVNFKTTSGEKINGGALVEGTTGVLLNTGQHMVVQYDGTRWLTVSGACKFYIGTTELAESVITNPKIAAGAVAAANLSLPIGGTATTLGFFGVTPLTQRGEIAGPVEELKSVRTAVEKIIATLEELGLVK